MNFRQNLFYEYVSICKFVSCILIICNLHLPLNDQMSDNHINRRQTRLLARHSYLSTPSVKNAYRLAGSSCFAIALLLSCFAIALCLLCYCFALVLLLPCGSCHMQGDNADLALSQWCVVLRADETTDPNRCFRFGHGHLARPLGCLCEVVPRRRYRSRKHGMACLLKAAEQA